MTTTSLQSRLARGCAITLTLASILTPVPASAQTAQAILELRPHCANQEMDSEFGGPIPPIEGVMTLTDGRCASYPAADPQNHQTPPMKVGDILDMDLILRNTNGNSIRSIRAWIAYDPSILEGTSLELGTKLPIPTPGELEYSKDEGYVKISASAGTDAAGNTIIVARLRMKVLSAGAPSTVLSFATDERTVAIHRDNGADLNILAPQQPSLIVRLESNGTTGSTSSVASTVASSVASTAATASSVASTALTSASSASSQSAGNPSSAPSVSSASSASSAQGIFTMLQPQNLRVTTQGTTLYAAWDPLGSVELAGYALYYSAVSGRYIQRRTVAKPDTSVIIRGLPEGTTYYLAVRGVNAAGQETEFSQEVAVTMGDATTATSLLTANTISPPSPGTGGHVAGATGAGTAAAVFLVLSAVIGTMFAFRRQLIASRA